MKTTRATLKEYFKKGAIPTAANFGDLIDSMLTQDEDNISKPPNDALKIIATGVEEALINFYRLEQSNEQLSWQIKQKPTNSKPGGLTISDATSSRLFIESGSGSVGIGTTSPSKKLEVNGAVRISSVTATETALSLGGNGDFQIDAPGVVAGRFVVKDSGNVGIGAANPTFKLQIKGSTSTNAELRLDPSKWSAVGDYGQISFGDANHYIRGEFTNGMKFHDTDKFVFSGGNVGIGTGTAALTRKLEVSGTVRIGSVTASEVALSLGGNGDFQIDASGVPAGRFVVKDGGNVGIGVAGPAEKLEVNGTIKFGSVDGWRLDTGSWQGANIRYSAGADDATNSATFGFHGGGNRTLNLRVDGNAYVEGSLGVGTTTPNFKLEVAGDVSVGAKTDNPATGYGAKLYFNGASENTDSLWMARYNDSNNVTFLRMNVGDDNSSDQLQIGNGYGGRWNTWLAVDASGEVKINGILTIGDWTIISQNTTHAGTTAPSEDRSSNFINAKELLIKCGNQIVARFSNGQDIFQAFRNKDGKSPYFYYNSGGGTGT